MQFGKIRSRYLISEIFKHVYSKTRFLKLCWNISSSYRDSCIRNYYYIHNVSLKEEKEFISLKEMNIAVNTPIDLLFLFTFLNQPKNITLEFNSIRIFSKLLNKLVANSYFNVEKLIISQKGEQQFNENQSFSMLFDFITKHHICNIEIQSAQFRIDNFIAICCYQNVTQLTINLDCISEEYKGAIENISYPKKLRTLQLINVKEINNIFVLSIPVDQQNLQLHLNNMKLEDQYQQLVIILKRIGVRHLTLTKWYDILSDKFNLPILLDFLKKADLLSLGLDVIEIRGKDQIESLASYFELGLVKFDDHFLKSGVQVKFSDFKLDNDTPLVIFEQESPRQFPQFDVFNTHRLLQFIQFLNQRVQKYEIKFRHLIAIWYILNIQNQYLIEEQIPELDAMIQSLEHNYQRLYGNLFMEFITESEFAQLNGLKEKKAQYEQINKTMNKYTEKPYDQKDDIKIKIKLKKPIDNIDLFFQNIESIELNKINEFIIDDVQSLLISCDQLRKFKCSSCPCIFHPELVQFLPEKLRSLKLLTEEPTQVNEDEYAKQDYVDSLKSLWKFNELISLEIAFPIAFRGFIEETIGMVMILPHLKKVKMSITKEPIQAQAQQQPAAQQQVQQPPAFGLPPQAQQLPVVQQQGRRQRTRRIRPPRQPQQWLIPTIKMNEIVKATDFNQIRKMIQNRFTPLQIDIRAIRIECEFNEFQDKVNDFGVHQIKFDPKFTLKQWMDFFIYYKLFP